MPELPEVETVRRTLENLILNKIVTKIEVRYPKIIQTDVSDFNRILGQKIHRIDRLGKHLIFILDHDVLLIHLRMEGRFFLRDKDTALNKHEHIGFQLDHKQVLIYHDVRKFGTMHLYSIETYLSESPLAKLGTEPMTMDVNSLYDQVSKRKTEIKTILLDQTVISGLGNIYVDETLFRAKIHPTRLGISLSKLEVENILMAAREVLHKAVLLGGTTIRTFEAMDGVHGRFQNELLVHTKVGEPCPVCGTTIIKMKVKGRGTYVCPRCQN